MNERVKLRFHRTFWLLLCLLFLFLPELIASTKPELEIVDAEVYISDYYSSLDETAVSINLVFNREIKSGYVTINFYDDLNQKIDTKSIYLIAYGDEAEGSYEVVNGQVDSYEIISYEFETYNPYLGLHIAVLPCGIMLISALLLNYKTYQYYGNVITVYAGWFHHVLRINGEKYDEHNTLMTFAPIYLSTTLENAKIEVTISTFNRIALKINDKLYVIAKFDT